MCTFYILTPSSPIILSGCDNLKFAPFNSSYATINEDAYASGLSDSLNLWDKPIVVTQNQSIINGSHWSLLDPKEFTQLTVPVEQLYTNKSQTTVSDLVTRANVS
jgi:TBCC domain-containing protein 1